jgi:hypothetical protein
VAQKLRVPTLILCGDRDKLTPPALSKQLSELIPGSRLLTVEAAGHMLPLEAPGLVNQEILNFVNLVAPREVRLVPLVSGIMKRSILRRLIGKITTLLRRG